MLRHEWKFRYTREELLAAARAKRKHHQSRVAWWEKQQSKTASEARRKGMVIEESIGMQYSTSNAMRGKQMVVDNKYQIRLNECFAKVQEHGAKVNEYDGWVQVFEGSSKAPADRFFDLNQDDYLYFFGNK